MLQFCYDFIDYYIGRRGFQYCEMDINLTWIACSSDNFDDLIKPLLKFQYDSNKNQWFSRYDTI